MKWVCVLVMLLCFVGVEIFLLILIDGKNEILLLLEIKNSESYEIILF